MTACFALLGATAAGCNDDGRTLRPARPGQDLTISTTAAPSTLEPGFDTVASTLPSESPYTITAPWRSGATIDPRYTCDGVNVSPAASWSPAPQGTVDISLTLTDDADPFVHWVIAGLGPDATSIAEGEVPLGAYQGTNSDGTVGYTGPCPPAGTTHHYRLTVHYMNQALEFGAGDDGQTMLFAVGAVSFASAEALGDYRRA